MDRKTLLALYDKELRIDIEYPDLLKEVTGGVVRFMGPPERQGSNFVLYCRLSVDNVESVISRQVSHFGRYKLPFEWKVFDHDSPPDLRSRLIAHGFKAREQDAIMVLLTREASTEILQPVTADVRRLTKPEQIQVMVDLLQEVWNVDFGWLQKLLEEDLWKRPTYSTVYMAYVDNVPASVGWIQFPENSQFATLWGGTTLPQFRESGLYSAILAARVQEAIKRGYGFLTIDATPMSRAIAEKFGFKLLTFAHSCFWEPISR